LSRKGAAGDFLNNRDDILDYVKALDDSFQAYIVSDEYACMNREDRATYVNSCNELKHFLFKLIEIKAVLNKVEFGQFASAQ